MNEEQRTIMRHMRNICNATKRHIDRYSDSKKQLDRLSVSGGWILSRVFESEHFGTPMYQRDFENEFGITRSTASKVLSGLEKKGLIRREGVAGDARLKRIVLTEKSNAISRNIFRETAEFEKKLERGFTPEELNTLFGFFERIENNLATADNEAVIREKKGKRERGACI